MWERYLINQEKQAARNLYRIRTEARGAKTGKQRDALAAEAHYYEAKFRSAQRQLRAESYRSQSAKSA